MNDSDLKMCNKKHKKLTWFFQLFTYLSSDIFFQILSLYFLLDMSDNSLYLRTNSIIFFIHLQRQQQTILIASKCLKYSGGDGRPHYRNRAGTGRSGPVPSRQPFSQQRSEGTVMLQNLDVIQQRCDGDIPVSVNNPV